ncbi:MAG: organic radical activating enzyme [Pseudohongiellaceae bacterium]|jgi:organic radical activating enzyme
MSHSIHDFSAKLRQPSVLPAVEAYVQWRRAVRAAQAAGETAPLAPSDHAPLSINLDLTTACNYRCDHCIDWDILNSPDKYDPDELLASITQMASRGLRSVILIGGGEPTIFPKFVEFVTALKKLKLQIAVVSNGSRGDRLLAIAPLLDERDWIRLSLDSGSNKLFREMHKPVDKNLDLDDICAWIPKIKAANSKPRLGFSFIITWEGANRDDCAVHENVQEIVEATKRAKSSGFDYISLKPFLERTPDGAEVMDPSSAGELSTMLKRIRVEVDKAKAFADDSFDVYESTNLRMLESGDWSEYTQQPKTCHMQAMRQVLTPTGLFNCPAHRGVKKARIADANGFATAEAAEQTTAKLATILDEFDASHECREVTCLYNKVNWWLEELIDSDEALVPSPEREDYFL